MSEDIWLYLDAAQAGGIEAHVLNLAQSLLRAGRHCRVVLHADHQQEQFCNVIRSKNIPLSILNGRPHALWQAARKNRPLLIHTHGYKAGILGRITARLLRLPVVSTFHSGDPGEGRVRLYSLLDRLTARLGAAIAVNALIAANVPGQAQVIPNFVSIPESGNTPRDLDCCFVGRLEAEKGPDLFCQLVEKLPSDIHCHMFGDGRMKGSLIESHANRLQFHGLIYPFEEYWPRIDLLCVTSRYEGLPLAVLEAMSHGVAVAAFDVGALPGLINNAVNGYIIPQGNLAEMAEVITNWRKRPEVEKDALREAARDTVSQRYSEQVVLQQILLVYDSITDTRLSTQSGNPQP